MPNSVDLLLSVTHTHTYTLVSMHANTHWHTHTNLNTHIHRKVTTPWWAHTQNICTCRLTHTHIYKHAAHCLMPWSLCSASLSSLSPYRVHLDLPPVKWGPGLWTSGWPRTTASSSGGQWSPRHTSHAKPRKRPLACTPLPRCPLILLVLQRPSRVRRA